MAFPPGAWGVSLMMERGPLSLPQSSRGLQTATFGSSEGRTARPELPICCCLPPLRSKVSPAGELGDSHLSFHFADQGMSLSVPFQLLVVADGPSHLPILTGRKLPVSIWAFAVFK